MACIKHTHDVDKFPYIVAVGAEACAALFFEAVNLIDLAVLVVACGMPRDMLRGSIA